MVRGIILDGYGVQATVINKGWRVQSFLATKETGTQGGRGGPDYAGGKGIIDLLLIRTVSW